VNHNNIASLYEIGIREFHLSGKEPNKFGELETNYENISNFFFSVNRRIDSYKL
jgi:hypothetical protein